MTRDQINIRLNDMTRRQLDELTSKLRISQTGLFNVAIDRMYQQEIGELRMMDNTTSVEFDPQRLPEWAQKIPTVVEGCRRDLGFRTNVYSANTQQYRNLLIRQASERWSDVVAEQERAAMFDEVFGEDQ